MHLQLLPVPVRNMINGMNPRGEKVISLSLDSSEFSHALSCALFTRILIIWYFINEAVEIQVKKFAQALKVGSYGIVTHSERTDALIQVF